MELSLKQVHYICHRDDKYDFWSEVLVSKYK